MIAAAGRAPRAPHLPDFFRLALHTGMRLGEMLGLEWRCVDLRHTCAAWLVQAGAALDRVRNLLGHTSVATTEIYAHLAPENVREAVNKLASTSQ